MNLARLLGPALLVGVACCAARQTPSPVELFEYGRWGDLERWLRASGSTNLFLEGVVLAKRGRGSEAAERFLACTNDPWLREYAFLRAGEALGEGGLVWLERAVRSTNVYIAYTAAVALAEAHGGAGRADEALRAWRLADEALSRKAPANLSLIPLLGPYHETRVRVAMARLLKERNDPSWLVLATDVLAKSRSSRWNPWTPLVLAMVTNERLVGWSRLYHTARHLMVFGNRGETVRRMAEAAMRSADTASRLFLSYEQLYALDGRTNLSQLGGKPSLRSNLRGTVYEDGLIYYTALEAHHDRRYEAARRGFWMVLTNAVTNREFETRAVGFMLDRPRTYLRDGWRPLMAAVRSRMTNRRASDPDMAAVWFRWVLRELMAKRRWSEALAVLTALPWSSERAYFIASCREASGDAAGALAGFRSVVEANGSSYYTVRALERIRAAHAKDGRLAERARGRAKELWARWTAPKRWPDPKAAAALMEILSWDPDFRLPREEAERLFALVPAGPTNRTAVRRILHFYGRFLLREGLVELVLNEPASPVLLGELAERFREWRMPYPQIWCAERLFRAVSGGLPAFVFDHPVAAAAYPRWYEAEVRKWMRSDEEAALGLALMREESRFRWDVVSVTGAAGLAQLMPFTYRKVLGEEGKNLPEITSPDANVEAGMRYLREQWTRFRSVPRALAAYNAGPVAVERWLASFGEGIDDDLFTELVPYDETRNYIKRIVVSRECYRVFAE